MKYSSEFALEFLQDITVARLRQTRRSANSSYPRFARGRLLTPEARAGVNSATPAVTSLRPRISKEVVDVECEHIEVSA